MAVTKSEHGLSHSNESLAVTGTFYQETQPVSGTVTANQGTGGTSPWCTKLHQGEVTGTLGALDAVLNADVDGCGSAGTAVFQISGTWTGKIVVEGAIDGTFVNLSIVQPGGAISFSGVNNDNQNGIYRVLLIAGYTKLRLRMSSYTSGTATAILNVAPLVPAAYSWQLNAANLQMTATQGAAGATAWKVDGSAVTQPVSGTVSAKITDVSSGAQAKVEARAQTPTGNALNVQIGPGDPISNVPVMIMFDHHQIHEGEIFCYWNNGALNAGTRDIRISVPVYAIPIRAPHLIIEAISDCTTVNIGLYEGVTWTSGGTEQTVFCRNRNITTAPASKIYAAGATALTVNSTGTQIWAGYLSSTAKVSLATDRQTQEWVLKSNTEYMLRCTSTGNGNLMLRLDWYEDLGV